MHSSSRPPAAVQLDESWQVVMFPLLQAQASSLLEQWASRLPMGFGHLLCKQLAQAAELTPSPGQYVPEYPGPDPPLLLLLLHAATAMAHAATPAENRILIASVLPRCSATIIVAHAPRGQASCAIPGKVPPRSRVPSGSARSRR